MNKMFIKSGIRPSNRDYLIYIDDNVLIIKLLPPLEERHDVNTTAKAHSFVNMSVSVATFWQNFPTNPAEKLTGIFTDYDTDILEK